MQSVLVGIPCLFCITLLCFCTMPEYPKNKIKLSYCSFVVLLTLAIFLKISESYGLEMRILSTARQDAVIYFEKALSDVADSLFNIYPDVKKELEKTIGWPIDFCPSIILVKDSSTFEKMSGSPNIVAFARPSQNFIFIDCSKIGIHPFTHEIILKHELCHLILHRYIPVDSMPKWFDEGVCQWVTGGIGEILSDKKPSLNNAVISGKLIVLYDLNNKFPSDKSSMELAYEESKSVVEFIGNTYGTEKLNDILNYLKNGETFENALKKTLFMTPGELEKKWHASFSRYISWLLFFAQYFYEIVFFTMAIVAVIAFIKIILKRREDSQF